MLESKESLCFIVSLCFVFFLLLVYFPEASRVWVLGIGSTLLCICMRYSLVQNKAYARKYLYRKDMYRESYPFLEECGFCSHLNPPDALDCQHCDASLRDSRSVEGQIPEWFSFVSKETKTHRKCPHCDAVYAYDLTEQKETLLCQNCSKQFPVSEEILE
jgi:hypothetical protein